MAIFGIKAATPFVNNASFDPRIDMCCILFAAHGEELRTVIKRGVTNASRCKATTNTAAFVEHNDIVPTSGKRLRRHQTRESGANNNDAH
jgi:hypothetical protein